MFNDVNSDSGSDRYFVEYVSFTSKKNFQEKIFAHININFIVHRVNDSFTSIQFHIKGYIHPFRLDRNAYRVGILVFVR